MSFTLNLPFPPSTNRLWRTGRNSATGKPLHYLDAEYKKWKSDASVYFLQQRARGTLGNAIKGHFNCSMVFDESQRKRRRDIDNRLKCVLDFTQYVELVEDDSLCDRIEASWGPVDGVQVKAVGSIVP